LNSLTGSLLQSFSVSSLIAGLVFGTAGLYIFNQGRKRPNLIWVIIGLALMIYPLFVSAPLPSWGIGFALCYGAYSTKNS